MMDNLTGDMTPAKEIACREASLHLSKEKATQLMLHTQEVVKRVLDSHGSPTMVEVAWLHDVIEDCCPDGLTPEEYAGTFAVADNIREAVLCLTRRDTETYAEYIDRVIAGPRIARFVKQCDLRANLAKCMREPSERSKSLEKRYRKALQLFKKRGSE